MNTVTPELAKRAKRMHTHRVVFSSQSLEETVASLAQLGASNECISQETGLSHSQVQYRISKAQGYVKKRFRQEWRQGQGIFRNVLRTHLGSARKYVQSKIAPAFLPLAAHRLNQ